MIFYSWIVRFRQVTVAEIDNVQQYVQMNIEMKMANNCEHRQSEWTLFGVWLKKTTIATT